ncbi:MAG TPA: SDR family NAD(P)-dependent oxidoreductase, partial [Afifellaceae bacterium]|nr:SDR family NAD(P)-dependent oxidoreductase [Afifellaceae bacterium]
MLKGKTAVVTGSTSGIGLGIVKALAGAGANVALNSYTDDEEDHKLAAEIAAEHGVGVLFIQADMSKSGDCESLVRKAAAELGPVQVLVNNAGIQHVEAVESFPPEKWDAILAINLSSSFHTIRTAVPGMKEAGWGRIVNIASAHGLTASPFKSAYVSAKHGMVGLTKTVALELAEFGVTCNAICPGYVMTPLVEG